MITFEMRTPTAAADETYVGVTGENLACTREFFIKGVTDADMDYRIHLRFSDGSVNSLIPDGTEINDEGTMLRWNVKKNDIFVHGCFELQIEGSINGGLIFQTEILTMYADESLAVEDKEYANPNSETLMLRDEAEKMLADVNTLQAALDQNLADINKTGIADKESLSNKVSTDDSVTSDSYPSVGYLKSYYYTASTVDEKLSAADGKVTSLETSLSETDERVTSLETSLSETDERVTSLETILSKTDEKVTSLETSLSKTDEKTASLETSLNETNTKLAQKVECESGSGTLEPAATSYEGCEGSYRYEKVGNIVALTVNLTRLNTGSNYFTMKGLPYPCNSAMNLLKFATITTKNFNCRVLVNGSWISFLRLSGNFAEDETITTTVVYTV